jgi:predicted methyltransferase
MGTATRRSFGAPAVRAWRGLFLVLLLLAAAAVAAQRQGDEQAREGWQKVDDIFTALGVAEGSRIADVGAGSGFFTIRLARRVGANGRVYAVDVAEGVVRRLRERIRRDDLENVEAILGEPDDPKLPAAALDAALIVNAYHEMREHEAMLRRILAALKPGGRLVIVEPSSTSSREQGRSEQERRHHIAPSLVKNDLVKAGFEIVELRDDFVTNRPGGSDEWMIVARTPVDAGVGNPAEAGSHVNLPRRS